MIWGYHYFWKHPYIIHEFHVFTFSPPCEGLLPKLVLRRVAQSAISLWRVSRQISRCFSNGTTIKSSLRSTRHGAIANREFRSTLSRSLCDLGWLKTCRWCDILCIISLSSIIFQLLFQKKTYLFAGALGFCCWILLDFC